ncbi:methyl-accepting chemotaxis protein [Rheinheimera soli]|uniref:Methyl-accepting chemotaxis protein n=1 Tax=Rheinheimera soli TaxID=443616 RepID=A0ABU1W3C9_9GAMM|nr:methyl-accepting chemotaxis protein [Rheinheimera soli]MDR7122494.1 methyl-accepting chemotaxis protein [Rheinheimera soli]
MQFNHLSIRHKLLLSLSSAVLIASVLISLISQSMTQTVLTDRMLNSELPKSLQQIKTSIETEIDHLSRIAQQLATSPQFHDFLDSNRDPAREQLLVAELENIKQRHALQAASFCNRELGDYWNEAGFLRRLNQQEDSWFFAFKDSGKASQVSVFNSPEVGYQIFVNYQQLDGRGLSGIAKPLTEMVTMISQYKIEQTGFVYLVNPQGQIQLHPEQSIGTALSAVLPEVDLSALLKPQGIQVLSATVKEQKLVLASVYVPSMDWYLVAQVPENEVFSVLDQIKQTSWVTAFLVTLVFAFISILLSNSISRPIQQLGELFARMGQGEANLSVRIEQQKGAELQQLTDGFNQFISKIANLISDIHQSSITLNAQAKALSEQSSLSLEQNQQQLASYNNVQQAMDQMEATVADIAQNSALAADSTSNVSQLGSKSKSCVDQASAHISSLSAEVTQVETVIKLLAEKADSISQILDVIRNVAEQTNLLALNAAIEAARAGEQGRGFAVVADEVRNLAARTQRSTTEIQDVISSLLSSTSAAVTAVTKADAKAQQGVELSQQVSHSLSAIAGQIQSLESMSLQIAAATEQQAMVTADVSSQLSLMNSVNKANVSSAEQMQQASQGLLTLAQQLNQLASRFSC